MKDKADITDPSRRQFLKDTVVLGGISIAPGVFLYGGDARADSGDSPRSKPVTDEKRWGMLVDTNQCVEGCDACVKACHDEHGIESFGRPEQDTQWIRKLTAKDKTTGYTVSLPMMCQHCESPPCVDVCPTGASFRRADGIVLVDPHTCIGCRYCMMACPYKARSFVHENLTEQLPHAPRGKGCVESCTMCVHKIDAGIETTACAEACKSDGHQAIIFGDLNDPKSAISLRLKKFGATQIRSDLNLNTGVRYQGI